MLELRSHTMSGEPVKPLRGHLDVVDGSRVKGWAFDPSDPEQAVVVELCDGNDVIARMAAMEMRPDLRDAGVGTGRYGFTFVLGPRLLPFARHVLRVRFAETGLDLPGSPAVRETEGAALLDSTALATMLRRRIDAVRDRDELGRFVAMLAGSLDHAFAQQEKVGRAVLSPQGSVPSTEPPASFREAVERIHERFVPFHLEPARRPVVSVVVVSRNAFVDSHACIRTIAANHAGVPLEVILVDDDSTDETLIARAVLPPAVRLFRTPRHAGPVHALRAGQALAQGRYILFLDPRARLAAGSVEAMVAAFESDPGVGLVGSRLQDGAGKVVACGVSLTATGDLVPVAAGLAANDPRVACRRDVDVVLSHAMMIEKVQWTRLAGFDEAYPDAAHADADLALKVRRSGLRVVTAAGAAATMALDPVTLGSDGSFEARSRFAAGRRRLVEAWQSALADRRYAELEPGTRVAGRPALVIDHAYPTPGKDAGSAAVMSHMRALQDNGYHVVFVPGGPAEAHPTATEALRRAGAECWHKPFVKGVQDLLERIGPTLEVVYIHRYPNAGAYLEVVRRLAPQARVIFSVADLHFLREERAAELHQDEAARQASLILRERELDVIGRVDAVVTHSTVEAAVIREAVPTAEVHVVPWTVSARPVTTPFEERSGLAFIGSYGHAPNADAARWLVNEVMPLVWKQDPDILLSLVGAGLPDDLAASRPGLRTVGWVEDLHADVFSRVRLTVAPLRYGAGLKGKVLDSLASGVACLMTPSAAEGLPNIAAVQRWTINGAEAFAEAILRLHSGQEPSSGELDEVRQAIADFTHPRSVARALATALAAKTPHHTSLQSAAS